MPCPSGPPSVPCWEHGLEASPPSRRWRHPGAGGRLFVWKVRPQDQQAAAVPPPPTPPRCPARIQNKLSPWIWGLRCFSSSYKRNDAPSPHPSPAPSPAPGKRSTVTACMLKGSFSLEKINHSDRPVFIICQLCKALFNFGGEKPELLRNQSGDEVSLEGGIIKGQMAAFRDTAARTWGGAPGREGTPRPRQPGGGAGRGRSGWTAPGRGRKHQRHRESLVRTPERPEPWLPGQVCGELATRGLCTPSSVGSALPATPGVGASGGKEGEGRQEDGGGLVSASPPTQAPWRVSVSLPDCVGDACAWASGL